MPLKELMHILKEFKLAETTCLIQEQVASVGRNSFGNITKARVVLLGVIVRKHLNRSQRFHIPSME